MSARIRRLNYSIRSEDTYVDLWGGLSCFMPGAARALWALLGHAHVETTMIYTHVLNKGGLGVVSPLD